MFHKKLLLLASFLYFSTILLSAQTLRIMPLGDSITYDNNHADDEGNPRPKSKRAGYRSYLWYMLQDAKQDVDFVGSRHTGSAITPPFDGDNEGYPGQSSYEIAEKTYAILQQNPPDVILLHIGTNDHDESIKGVESILNWVDTYENDTNHEIRVIVALIIGRTVPDEHIEGFNHNLEKLVTNRWKKGDRLTLVDMYRGAHLNDNDYSDSTHPNSSGYQKMAKVWFDALMTPYVPFSTAPLTEDDKVSTETGTTVSIDVLTNDKDYQNDMDRNSVTFIDGSSKLSVKGEGEWSINKDGIVTFRPDTSFTSDPTPVQYTVKDAEGTESKPATITIDYSNSSLESFPTSIVDDSYIESLTIHEDTNTVEFITRVPDSGIKF